MLASNNILKLSDGAPVCSPTLDMVMGSYYLTMDKPRSKGEGMTFCDADEAKMAYFNKTMPLITSLFTQKLISGSNIFSKLSRTT